MVVTTLEGTKKVFNAVSIKTLTPITFDVSLAWAFWPQASSPWFLNLKWVCQSHMTEVYNLVRLLLQDNHRLRFTKSMGERQDATPILTELLMDEYTTRLVKNGIVSSEAGRITKSREATCKAN